MILAGCWPWEASSMKRVPIAHACAVLVVLLAGALCSSAQTAVSWNGGIGNWNTAADWSGGVVPNNGGGKAYDVTISNNNPTVTLNLGVTISDLTLGSTATLQSAANNSLTIAGNGTLTNNGTISFSTSGSNLTLDSGSTLINNGTLDLLSSGETLSVTGATTNSGSMLIQGGGTATFTGNFTNSGSLDTGFVGGKNVLTVTGTFTNSATGSVGLFASGDVLNVNALSNSGALTIYSGATLNITAGGQGLTDVAQGSSLTVNGTLDVKNGSTFTNGLGNLTSVEGQLNLNNGQTTAIAPNGGTLTIAGGGNVNISDGAKSNTTVTISGSVSNSGGLTTGFSGGTNTISITGTLTNNSGGSLTIYGGAGNGSGSDSVSIGTLNNCGTVSLMGTGSTLTITGTGTLTNSGTLNLTQGALKFSGLSATLTGGGTLTLGNSSGTQTGSIQVGSSNNGTFTNSDNTITGYGNLGSGTLTLVNQGTINANGNVSLARGITLQPGGGGMTNTGVMEATNQGTLVLQGTFNNTGGTIQALGEAGGTIAPTVQLISGTVINGGTLNTTTMGANAGLIENTTGSVTLNGVANLGTYADTAGATTILEGTIANSGSITLSGSTLSLGNSVTLNGKGTVVLSNSATNLITAASTGLTLTNANTIEGAGTIQNMGIVNTGTISANQSGLLILLPSAAGLNNKGTLSVSTGDTMQIGTAAGGALVNFAGTTLTGGTYAVSGTLQFGATGTSIVSDAANISLTGTGARMIDFAGENVLAGLASITQAGSFTIGGGANFTTAGNFTNSGKLTVNSGSTLNVTGSLSNFNSANNTLNGGTYTVGGKLEFAGANVVTDAANLTINGTGEILDSNSGGNGLANLAIIATSGSFTLGNRANFTTAGNFTDNGKLTINSGTALTVGKNLTNFDSATNTLTSGTYTIGGTLKFTGANIVNNAANLTISGSSAQILNGTSNGLANFANNTGAFTLTGNGSLTTGSSSFSNSGTLSVMAGSTLTVGGGNSYNQSAGTSTVDGTLGAAWGINVTGGTVQGAGKLSGNVKVGGSGTAPTLNVGDSGKAGLLAITGSYTQLSGASMSVFIGGTGVGTQYSQLQVSSSATLAGTISVALASGFTPTIGSSFTVLTATSIAGTFSNSTIAINGSEHFNVSYTATGVVLTVASGSAPLSGGFAMSTFTAGLAGSALRHGPGGDRILVAGMGNSRARSGAFVSAGGGQQRYPAPVRVVIPRSHALAPAIPQTPVVTRVNELTLAGGRVSLDRDWTGPLRVLSRRTAVSGVSRPHVPLRALPPLLSRLRR